MLDGIAPTKRPSGDSRLTDILRQVVTTRRGCRLRRAALLAVVCRWAHWEGFRVAERDVRRALTRAFSRPPSRRRRRHCLDCGIDTVAIGEYPYHLRDELWYAIVPSGRGMLCLDCVERRLGR